VKTIQRVIVGIDEVGRGCLAGPVVASAVVLAEPIKGVKDSKKLTKLQREKLAIIIRKRALAIGTARAEATEIDTVGLTEALRQAMQKALQQISITFDEIIIDGSFNFLADIPGARAVVKADDLVPAVSAASIMAKVTRDALMTEAAKTYQGYGFERHVGYGTAQHLRALQQLGVCELHRRSFAPVMACLGGSA
jgi:ribonuclease HII